MSLKIVPCTLVAWPVHKRTQRVLPMAQRTKKQNIMSKRHKYFWQLLLTFSTWHEVSVTQLQRNHHREFVAFLVILFTFWFISIVFLFLTFCRTHAHYTMIIVHRRTLFSRQFFRNKRRCSTWNSSPSGFCNCNSNTGKQKLMQSDDLLQEIQLCVFLPKKVMTKKYCRFRVHKQALSSRNTPGCLSCCREPVLFCFTEQSSY